MIYIHNKFKGHYPVGTAAVVCEKTPEKAALVLEAYLRGIGLEQKINPKDMVTFKMVPGNCAILNDGDY